jgi:tetratricopeptide (TPR) repeat protein
LLRYSLTIALTLLIFAAADPVLAQAGCSAEQGQLLIDQGRYRQAVRQFTCVIDAQPTAIEGYRGRIEAQLFLGLYSDAMRDYGRVTALVLPADADAVTTLLAGYATRLADDPHSVSALTGASFARWWLFQYAESTHLLNDLLAIRPDDLYGNLFRGSSRLLRGATNAGVADLDKAIALDPENPHLHWVVADAYTYGLFDPQQAFLHAQLALNGGLDTPRVHAILATAYLAFGDLAASVQHIDRHLDLVMTELVTAPTLFAGDSLEVAAAPGRVVEIPVPAFAGQTIAIVTGSKDYWDTIAVLLAPDGTPVAGSDDGKSYFAAFEWPAAQTAIYRLRVTFFEALNFGTILVGRK